MPLMKEYVKHVQGTKLGMICKKIINIKPMLNLCILGGGGGQGVQNLSMEVEVVVTIFENNVPPYQIRTLLHLHSQTCRTGMNMASHGL